MYPHLGTLAPDTFFEEARFFLSPPHTPTSTVIPGISLGIPQHSPTHLLCNTPPPIQARHTHPSVHLPCPALPCPNLPCPHYRSHTAFDILSPAPPKKIPHPSLRMLLPFLTVLHTHTLLTAPALLHYVSFLPINPMDTVAYTPPQTSLQAPPPSLPGPSSALRTSKFPLGLHLPPHPTASFSSAPPSHPKSDSIAHRYSNPAPTDLQPQP